MFSGERGYKVLGEKAIIVEINNVRVNNNQEKLEFMKVNVCHILCKRDEFKFHKWIDRVICNIQLFVSIDDAIRSNSMEVFHP